MELEKVRHAAAHKAHSMLREASVQQSAKITVQIQRERCHQNEEDRTKRESAG